jgi:hypothetical protein
VSNSRSSGRSYAADLHEEKAQREGKGLIGFLSDLDWLKAAELTDGRPLDEAKITTSEKLFIFLRGSKLAGGFHFLIGVFDFVLIIMFTWLGIPVLSKVVSFLLELLGKIFLPIYLIKEYYLFPRGLVYTYLKNYLLGLSTTFFIFGFVSAILKTIIFVFANILKGTGGGIEKIITFLEKWYPPVVNPYYFAFEWLMVFLSLFPVIYFYYYAKKHPLREKPYIPLDYIPKADEYNT